MYIQDDYWEAVRELPKTSQDRILGSLVRLFYLDEREPSLKAGEKAVFVALRDRVILSRKRTKAVQSRYKSDGGDDSKPPANADTKQTTNVPTKPGTKRATNADTNGLQNERDLLKSEIEIESTTRDSTFIATSTLSEQGGSSGEIEQEQEGFAVFYALALRLWNEATGQIFTAFPGPARRGLSEAYRSGHREEDLRRVIRVVGTWEPRYLTPNAAFADGKFEQWLNRPEEVTRDDFSHLDHVSG